MKQIFKSIIKFLLPLSLSMAVLYSCGPSRYTMHLEMRKPSKSGVNLLGKTVSVVYLENGIQMNDEFSSYMSGGFADSIEKAYGTGEGSVGVFRMPRNRGVDYSCKDTLVNLLMDTGSDVVFLIDTVKFGVMSMQAPTKVAYAVSADSSYINTGSIPYTIMIYCFDAMDPKEEIKTFGGTSVAQPSVYSSGKEPVETMKEQAYDVLGKEGWHVGKLVAASFEPQWMTEGLPILYYESEKWIQALKSADQFQWKSAMDIWLELIESKDIMRRSCAAYNLALACYVSGDLKLAKEWLDLSDKECELPVSSSLRKKIN